MTDKAISKRSLQNLTQFNQEARQVARESMEIALLTLLEKKPLGDITISELVTKAGFLVTLSIAIITQKKPS